jgi:hypothetical protein
MYAICAGVSANHDAAGLAHVAEELGELGDGLLDSDEVGLAGLDGAEGGARRVGATGLEGLGGVRGAHRGDRATHRLGKDAGLGVLDGLADLVVGR